VRSDLHNFETFMKRRETASRAFVNGDLVPYERMATHVSPATFFGPEGGYRNGLDEVTAGYKSDAATFHPPDGDSSFEILHMAASDSIAYWVGLQRATARMRGNTDAVSMTLRVTEIFRREEGEWKIIHRHVDALASEAHM
jgi:ketosteroid isomerase-like protein